MTIIYTINCYFACQLNSKKLKMSTNNDNNGHHTHEANPYSLINHCKSDITRNVEKYAQFIQNHTCGYC